IRDMVGQYIQKKEEEKRIEEEQAAKDHDDDDDEESSVPLKDIIIYGLPPCVAITPVLFTKESVDSLIMEDEHLDTIPETESDELIKSSVEDLVQILSESEDSSKGECDLPPYNDSSKNHDLTFSNPLFDIDEDFTSSDESFSEEDVPNEKFKIFSNPLFDLDKEITSAKVDQIDDEVLESIDSIPPGIDSFDAESNLLESLLHRDTSINDSQKIDSLLDEFTGELTLLKLIPSEIDDVNLDPEGDIFNKIYDPGICIEVESTRILATLSPMINTLLPFSSENEYKVFNHGVLANKEKSPPSSSHRGLKALNSTIDVVDCPDCDGSRARGFCPTITRASNPQLHLGNPIS
ncbi:hypothetical protein Tco_0816331, partial [Tanacetum coccineum]